MARNAAHRGRAWRRPSGAARLFLVVAVAGLWAAPAAGDDAQAQLRARADAEIAARLDGWLALYRHLHAHPELSLQEAQTSALVADRLEAAGLRVTRGVGGHGVVALLERGPGPTLLVRGDMDALPVAEMTGLPYASAVRATGPDGESVPVMHACGHDVHTTHLVAIGELFAALGDGWQGRLMLVAQPAEETGEGSLAMLNDGLFERFPRPDATLALHVEPALPAGVLGVTRGFSGANVDAVDIAIFGRGGHGARPHQTVDPIVAAAHLVTALQTLVSRRVDPQAPAVVTVGSIHGGSKHNVIPDRVDLQLTVRSYSDDVRALLLDGIQQLARDLCVAFGCPRPPDVRIRANYTPALYNDPELAQRAEAVFAAVVGADRVVPRPPSMGGDDFGRFGRALGAPSLLFHVGATPRERWDAAQQPGAAPLPTLHSGDFAPDPEPTLAAAVRAMAALVLELSQGPPATAPPGES